MVTIALLISAFCVGYSVCALINRVPPCPQSVIITLTSLAAVAALCISQLTV